MDLLRTRTVHGRSCSRRIARLGTLGLSRIGSAPIGTFSIRRLDGQACLGRAGLEHL